MTIQTKLRARVSPQVISKVTRIFNGTLDDIFNLCGITSHAFS